MPALTTNYESFEKPGLVVNYKLAAVKVYKGGMLGLNAAGYVTPMTHATANLKFVGLANETIDNSAGAAGDRSLNVTKTGSFVLKAASGYTPVIADLGKEIYALTDWETQISTAGLTNAYKVGTIVGLESTSTGAVGVRVRIDNYSV
jgi:hypothetical protein